VSPYISDDLSVLLATDVIHPNDNKELITAGVEVTIVRTFFLRGGYRFGDDTARASAGLGVSVPAGDVRIGFDYAFVAYAYLPSVQRFSVGLEF
jgi:hypothetical protein